MTLYERKYLEDYAISLYKCYLELVELGFDFEKNSAQSLLECIMYLYNRDEDDVPKNM